MAEIVVVHGYPGSGKTTQCERVSLEGLNGRGVQHVSVGNRLRDIRTHAVASAFSDFINAPDAPYDLPDEIVRGAIFEALETPQEDELILIDGYPRYVHALDDFYAALAADNHSLLGTIDFDVSLEKSIERVVSRGPRAGATIPSDNLESSTIFRYNRHKQTTLITLLSLSNAAPVETIDASGDKDDVYDRFTAALGRLALSNSTPEHHT